MAARDIAIARSGGVIRQEIWRALYEIGAVATPVPPPDPKQRRKPMLRLITNEMMPLRERCLPPGLAPRYLSREQAAAYVGVSASVFDAEVRSGQWPLGRRRGAKDGRLTWDRLLLDQYADRHSGIVHYFTPGPGNASEAMTRDAEAEAMERSAHVPPSRNRHQHGRKKAA
jgi:hypothetical protein